MYKEYISGFNLVSKYLCLLNFYSKSSGSSVNMCYYMWTTIYIWLNSYKELHTATNVTKTPRFTK